MGLQVFKINADGTTSEISTEGAIKDVLETTESYVIVSDDNRKVYLWKGAKSSVRSKFIGAKRSQEIRGQVGMHYSVVPLDEGDEDDEFIKIIGGRTEAGIAKEIREDTSAAGVNPLRAAPVFDAPRPAAGMNIAGSKERSNINTGPLYTGESSMAQFMQDEVQVNFEVIMQKLEEIALPQGYERELIIIGSHAYSVVEKVQTFLGQKKVEKVVERVGSIPEGIFFAEGYSPRVLSENGKILAIEFLKRTGGATSRPVTHKDKRQILKDQIKIQLGGK
ncbi:MAG: hypothetical protein ACTSQJ_11230 [Promethearchaeota archaeon]